MAIFTVGPNSTFPTIAAAMAAAGPGDIISLEAGYSNETVTVLHSGMTIDGGPDSVGIVLVLGSGVATVTLIGTAPIDVRDGGDGNGIVGNDGDNVITVTGGADSVSGGLGEDRLVVDYRLATGAITGDSTSNVAEAGGGGRLVTIVGGFEDFTIWTGSGADTITTGAGDDDIRTGEGASTVTAGEGANYIVGGSGADTITAGGGGNFIDGGDGVNTITSGDGADEILSGGGDDTIVAGAGDDSTTVTGGADTVDSGIGDDLLTVDYSASNTAVVGGVTGGTLLGGYSGHIANLAGATVDFVTTERFSITTGSGDDVLATGDYDDVFMTGAGDDTIDGGGGDDTLRLSGNRADYDVTDNGDGTFTIVDLRTGSPDDTDTVTNIEFLTFTDGTFAIDAPTNDSPVAFDDVLAATEDAPVTYAAADLLTNDTDGDLDALEIAGVSNVTGGAAVLNANGTVTFTPTGDFNGDAGFDYEVSDGNGGSDTGHATIAVAAVNDAPVLDLNGAGSGTSANNGLFEQDPTGAGGVAYAATVLDVDSADFAGGTLTVAFTANAEAGDLLGFRSFSGGPGHIIGASGNELRYNNVLIGTYTAGDDDTALVVTLNGSATAEAVQELVRAVNMTHMSDATSAAARTLTYTLTDGDGGTSSAVATVSVTADNDAPVLSTPTDIAIGYTENAATPTALMQGVTLSDPDLPASFAGGGLSLAVSGPGGGIDLRGGSSFVVSDNGNGTFGLIYQNGMTQVAIGTISGLATTNVQISGLTAGATLARMNDLIDDFTFLVAGDDPQAGDRTVTLTVNDGNNVGSIFSSALTGSATQTITIVATDDPGTATADTGATDEATVTVIDVLGNDSDVDSALSVSAVNGAAVTVGEAVELPSGALLTLNADGTFSYDPNGAFDTTPAPGSGASNMPSHDSFTYTLTGGSTATVSLTITGIDTDDVLIGTSGDDSLSGGAGRDVLVGLAGNDLLRGGAGVANEVYGGAGDDTYFVQVASDTLVERRNEGTDRVLTALASYSIEGLADIENLTGLSGSSQMLTGNAGDNVIIAGTGNDQLYGGLGRDVLAGFDGNDLLAGGDGIANEVIGGRGNDVYVVTAFGDTLVELAAEGTDTVRTTLASYTLLDNFETLIFTGTGNFAGTGNSAANLIVGGAGDDRLAGGGGIANEVVGGAGNDTYVVSLVGDTLIEQAGGGTDTVETALASYTLWAAEVENLTGTSVGQSLRGSAGANVITGAGGNDVLAGGLGADTLVGNGGADGYLFDTALGGGNIDAITGFVSGSDRILLDNTIFAALPEGPLAAGAFVLGTAALDADDRILYDAATGNLFYDADGNGAGAAVQFATLSGHPIINAGDFGVI